MATPAKVKVSKEGRITIPKALREGFCAPGELLTVEPVDGGLMLRRVENPTDSTGKPTEIKFGQESRPDPDREQRRKQMRKALLDSRAL